MGRAGGALLIATSMLAAGCAEVEVGDVAIAGAACEAMCAVQAAAPGCDAVKVPCANTCINDGASFGGLCVLASQRYYACAAEVAWSCPVRPDQPVTDDDRCAEEQHAYLVCRVTGEPPP